VTSARAAVIATLVVLAGGVFGDASATAAPGSQGAVIRHAAGAPGVAERAPKAPKPEFVRQAQRALRDLGYRPGPIDGVVGPQTHAALAKYQEAESLPVTGKLDLESMARLDIYRRLLRARSS
jgi:peptidoglycan hydrolase-like protein with peptidoglycan-binding domain